MGTRKGQGQDTAGALSSHLLATCHFLSVATQLTSSSKDVVKDFRKKKKKKEEKTLFFLHMHLTDVTDFNMRFTQIAECTV